MVDGYYANEWKKVGDQLVDKGLLEPNQNTTLGHMVDSPDRENYVLAEELLRLKVADVLVEGLNAGQVDGFLRIVDYLTNPSDNCGVVLKGYAGTGKTYLVKRIIEYIANAYPHKKIAITAPTNKAVQQLVKISPFSDESCIFEDYGKAESRMVYCTIHKLLGLKEEISDSGVQSFVTAIQDADILRYQFLIVDEVSMLDDLLFKKLLPFSNKIRFIFMGDPCQIPPINRLHSIPLKEDAPYPLTRLELTQIMRQKGDNPIIDAGMIIRSNLMDANVTSVIHTKLNANKKGIVCINAKTERTRIKDVIDRLFMDPAYQEDSDFVKIIAWQNTTVRYLNNIVRKKLFGDIPDKFVIGDRLIANKALFQREEVRRYSSCLYKIKANTSDEFIVTNVSIVERRFEESIFNSPTIKFTGNFWKITVKTRQNNELILYSVCDDYSATTYKKILAQLKKDAIALKSRDYWLMYYNMLKWSDDIIYNYAITAHKSQGSTYTHVILIEEDINFNKRIVERNRIKYTAYTRATDRVYVLK